MHAHEDRRSLLTSGSDGWLQISAIAWLERVRAPVPPSSDSESCPRAFSPFEGKKVKVAGILRDRTHSLRERLPRRAALFQVFADGRRAGLHSRLQKTKPRIPARNNGRPVFSEEQFEAYRALGFHMVEHFFDQDARIRLPDRGGWRVRECARSACGDPPRIAPAPLVIEDNSTFRSRPWLWMRTNC